MDLLRRKFSGGELSPWMTGRTDLPQHESGCRQLRNLVVLTTGEAARRPGFEVAAETAAPVRLVAFIHKNKRYILALGDHTMTVFKSEART